MKKINCLLTRKFNNQDIECLKESLSNKIQILIPDDYTDEGIINYFKNFPVEICLGEIPNSTVLKAAANLRLIQIPWNGIDNIPIPTDVNESITICNSHSNAASVAELAVALMFSLIKWIPLHDKSMRKNDWRRPGGSSAFIPPDLLQGKMIGIIGFGHIGYLTSRLLDGFNVSIQAVSRTGLDRFNSGVELNDISWLNDLLRQSDIVLITLPLTTKTRNLIGKAELELMKKSAYLVNVSRGSIIDEMALFYTLEQREICGAALDVWYAYPSRGKSVCEPSKYPFHKLENVVMSPHRGGFAKDIVPHLEDVIANLNNYANGKELINQVNISEFY